MIDFTNKAFIKLSSINNIEGKNMTADIRLSNEECLASYKSVRDYVIFTDRRIISIDTQGVSGRKKDYTSMPYSKINVYSIETAGMRDFDSELELYFSGIGKIKFEFTDYADIKLIGKLISTFIFGDKEEQQVIIKTLLSGDNYDTSNIEAGPNEWKCKNCGRINQDYVGTCGCGQHK